MQEYYAPSSWYELDDSLCRECPECLKRETDAKHAADHFHAILHILYNRTGHIDLMQLNDHIDEVQSALEMNFRYPKWFPQIERIKQ